MKRKLFALLLSLCMALTMMPTMAFADDEENTQQPEFQSMIFSESPLTINNDKIATLGEDVAADWLELINADESGEKKVSGYLYLATVEKIESGEIESGENSTWIAKNVVPLDASDFDIQYIVGPEGASIPGTSGLTIVKAEDGKESTNYYTITATPSQQLRYSEGFREYDVWPNDKDGKQMKVYNFRVVVGDIEEIEQKQLVISARSDLAGLETISGNDNLEIITPELELDADGSYTFSGYPYIATVNRLDDGGTRYISFVKLEDSQSIEAFYKNSDNDGIPGTTKSNSWEVTELTGENASQTGEYSFTYQKGGGDEYDHVMDDDIYGRCYQLMVSGSGAVAAGVRPLYIPFERSKDSEDSGNNDEPEYSIQYEMLIDSYEYTDASGNKLANASGEMWGVSQGTNMVFTDGMVGEDNKAHWYTCFYVVSKANGGRDVSYDPAEGGNEIRKHIGTADDFAIEARQKNGGDWFVVDQQCSKPAYGIFTISSVANTKNFDNVFKIEYDKNENEITTDEGKTSYWTDSYDFRIVYKGNNEWLNGENSCRELEITFEKSAGATDFSFDQYYLGGYDTQEGELWSTGNVQYFDKVGKTLKTKMILRPAGSFDHEKKVYYGEEFFTYITGEAAISNFKFYSRPATGDGAWSRVSDDQLPFTIKWVPGTDADSEKSGYYEITYDKPKNDKYGPEYAVKYEDNEWQSLIAGQLSSEANAKLNMNGSTLQDESMFWTRKLTKYVGKLDYDSNGKCYRTEALTDAEINTTEVILNRGAMSAGNNDKSVQINTNQATVNFNGELVKNMQMANSENAVSFTVQNAKEEMNGLTAKQVERVNDKSTVAALDLSLDLSVKSGENKIEFGSGSAEVFVGLDKEQFKAVKDKNLTVYYVDDNGKATKVGSAKVEQYPEGDSGELIFTTNHFSTYIVSTDGTLDSSSSGSSSGGYIAPTKDTVTNTTEDKKTDTSTDTGSTTETTKVATTTATVKTETKTATDGTKTVAATVDTTTATKIVEKAVENKSEEVVIDTATTSSTGTTAVTETAAGTTTKVDLPEQTVKAIAEKTEAAVTIKSDAAEIKLDTEAVKAVAEQAGDTGTVNLVVETVAQNETKVEVDLKLVTSKGTVSDFKGGNVKVTVKLNTKLAAKPVVCVYIDNYGTYHKVKGVKNVDGTYTFETGHFSTYAVMAEEEADKVIAEQTANVDKLISALTLKARSAKTAKGNIKVTLTADEEAIKAIEDLGYTVKYKFYRSTKKAKGYKAKLEGTGKTYTNTTGKKGTKYYYKARVMVYDAQGELIAKTALKQCKYAARTK